MNYQDIIGTFNTTKNGEKFIVVSYEGDKNYIIKFLKSAKTKRVTRSQILQNNITEKTRRKKVDIFDTKKEANSKLCKGKDLVLMAIDGATHYTGVALFKSNSLTHICEVSATHRNKFKRIRTTTNKIYELIQKYNVNYIVLEDIYYDRGKFNVFLTLANLQGALVDTFERLGIRYSLITAKEWKASMGTNLKREESKNKAVELISKEINRRATDNEAEAVLIGYHFIKKYVDFT